MSCTHYKVWRMGRTGHVSRREAGVWYSFVPDEQFGSLATYNEICVQRPYYTYSFFFLCCELFGERVANEYLTRAALAGDKGTARHAMYYEFELSAVPVLHALGHDSVIIAPGRMLVEGPTRPKWLWVLPTKSSTSTRARITLF